MRRWLLAGLLLLAGFAAPFAAAPSPAWAVEPRERLADPALEARARLISSQLRCLVCQNESIDDSGADLAHDIRVFVRERLTAGDTDVQTVQAMVNRYGSFVLLKPPVEPATYVLWYGPPVLVAVGLVGALLWIKGRRPGIAVTAPLSAEETRRVEGLMHGTDV
jgi:cytochrome c-type biogenesis protein CcmH